MKTIQRMYWVGVGQPYPLTTTIDLGRRGTRHKIREPRFNSTDAVDQTGLATIRFISFPPMLKPILALAQVTNPFLPWSEI